jgi:hypothetical protein
MNALRYLWREVNPSHLILSAAILSLMLAFVALRISSNPTRDREPFTSAHDVIDVYENEDEEGTSGSQLLLNPDLKDFVSGAVYALAIPCPLVESARSDLLLRASLGLRDPLFRPPRVALL